MSRFKEIVGGVNPIKYEMRAAPRRRIKGEDADDQPVFLRKAFVMMSSCPPEIGGWSEKGDTVVVKDVKLFAEKIIPTAYKHNNFSSFVRQLNFYGFRKIKSENPDHAAWWEFRHPNFLRDQPQLLADIKRSVHYVNDSPNVHEVSELKSQVGSLTDRISALHEQIEFLTGAVTQMQLSGEHKSRTSTYDGDDLCSSTTADSANKKRKVGAGVRIKSELTPSVDSSEEAEGDGAFNLMRMCSIESSLDLAAHGEQLPTGPELQSLGLFRGSSVQSFSGVGSNVGGDTSFMFDEEEAAWGADMEHLLALSETLVDQDRSAAQSSTTSANAAVSVGAKLDSKAAHYQPYYSTASVAAVPVKAEKEQVAGEEYADLPHASMVPAHNVFPAPVAPAASAGVRDLFGLLESLSPELKIRFVDKLAEVMGRQLSANMNTAAAPAAAVASPTESGSIAVAGGGELSLPSSSSSSSSSSSVGPSPAQSFAQLTRGSNAPFHLPSGGEAPEIALPLASAALGAFVMSSLNSLVLNQQQTEAAAARNKLA